MPSTPIFLSGIREEQQVSILSNFIRDNKHSFCTAVVLAAGSSTRMGTDKMALELGGIPVLARTLLTVDSFRCVDEIIVVTRLDNIEACASLCDRYHINKVTAVISGGATRTESALAGATAADRRARIIAIHDGARPFVTEEVFEQTVHTAVLYGAAAPAVKVHDTVKRAENGVVLETPDRETLFAVQTPQAFEADIIKGALTKAITDDAQYTDDCAAVEALGVSVRLTQGEYENIKLTSPLDIFLGEAVLKSRGECR